MGVKIKGNFKKLIYSNNNFNIYSFKLKTNQNELKEELRITDGTSYLNVISTTNNIDMSLDYIIDVDVVHKPNSKYKINYNVKNIEVLFSDQKESVIKYLSSSFFKGISTKSATKLVDAIGIDFVKNVSNYEVKIIEVLGNVKGQIIIDVLASSNEMNEITKIFIENNLSTNMLNYISSIKKYKLLHFLENNIYDIINEDDFNDYIELNKIAKYFYKEYNEHIAHKYLVLHETYKIEFNGSTINKIKKIYKNVIQYMYMSIDEFKSIVVELSNENKVVIDEAKTSITSRKIYDKEQYIASRIKKLIRQNEKNKININNLITDILDENQKKALIDSMSNSISIITGGPGTGKTMLIRILIKNIKNFYDEKKVELLAPTGKAATQICLKTSESARTFHSFLKWNERTFDVNEQKPSDVEVIIIDEFSMININLMYSLFKGCPNLKHLVLVGDKDQLPAIGAGNLLNDFISSNKICTSVLKKIYRQNEGSLIAQNSILINQSKFPIFDEHESILYNITNNEDAIKYIINEIDEFLEDYDDLFEFQILIPMYARELGIDNINKMIQEHINKDNNVLFKLNDKNYYLNDKVIQLENNNDKNIYNGEIGKIVYADFYSNEDGRIIIEFDNNRKIEYTKKEFSKDVSLAYAISVHKFQGSECNNVVTILSNDHKVMLSKKLFYTAYTRARIKNIVISTKEIINYSINNDQDSKRDTNMLKMLI